MGLNLFLSLASSCIFSLDGEEMLMMEQNVYYIILKMRKLSVPFFISLLAGSMVPSMRLMYFIQAPNPSHYLGYSLVQHFS